MHSIGSYCDHCFSVTDGYHSHMTIASRDCDNHIRLIPVPKVDLFRCRYYFIVVAEIQIAL